ncbi:MAG TPA: hypothetical protein VGP43_05835 [Chitinophagaceae bacterium]|nr:hypothetical protein [Chitinophagaceae bacterium]
MKQVLFFVIILTASCNDNSKQTGSSSKDEDTSKPVENKVMIPSTVCYSSIAGKDTVLLKTEIFPNVVSGTLSYKFFEKDSNKGDINGKLNGDTLVAEFTFMSEGKRSIRQVVFLIKDSTAIEGYASMEEKDGKMVFKNLSEVDFTKGIKLRKVQCPLE